MKTSHKKNRPFDFKLINLVEPQPLLYQRQTGLSTFEAMKAKTVLWDEISAQLGVSAQFCIMRWGNLRGQYQKELRQCSELCPKEGVIRGSSWPYLERLSFLESTIQFNKPKRVRTKTKQQKGGKNRGAKQAASSTAINNNASEDSIMTIETDADMQSDEAAASELLGELINDDSDFYIIQDSENAENVVVVEDEQQSTNVPAAASSADNLQHMATLLMDIEGENLLRIERRIMAFLCKCQLRALNNECVDDLVI